MKIVNVPYNRNIHQVITIILSIIWSISFSVSISSAINFDWLNLLFSSLVTISITIYFSLILSMRIVILAKDDVDIIWIKAVDKYGFSIFKFSKKEILRFEWKDIESCKLDMNEYLMIKFNNGKQLDLNKKSDTWFWLLSQIPNDKLLDNQIPNYLEIVQKSMLTCKVCGVIAVRNVKCMSCGSAIFNKKEHEEFENELEYIKEEQLDWFEIDNKHEKVEFYDKENKFFKFDNSWRPSVTESEVFEYSKEFWD